MIDWILYRVVWTVGVAVVAAVLVAVGWVAWVWPDAGRLFAAFAAGAALAGRACWQHWRDEVTDARLRVSRIEEPDVVTETHMDGYILGGGLRAERPS